MSEDDAVQLFEALMACRSDKEGPAQSLADGIIELMVMDPTTELDSLRCEVPQDVLEGLVPQWERRAAEEFPAARLVMRL